MKLLVIFFILAILLMAATPLITSASSYGSPSRSTTFSPSLAVGPLNLKNRTLTSPNVQSFGDFGFSVSISSNLVAVGAPYENASGYQYAGHVYIFNATTGKLIQTLTSPNAQYDGLFGWAVATSDKLVTVGALYETVDGYSEAGHAYVFNANTGKLIQTLTSPNGQSYGTFGESVSMSGTLVSVGAEGETADGYTYAGHAYVFNANTGKLIQTLTSPNAQLGGFFGTSVSISGKLVAVGAYHEKADGYSGAGHAYVFNANTGKLIQTLTSPSAQHHGWFGWSVSISGKLVAVGAIGEKVDGNIFAGHAYVFNANTGKLIETLTSPNAQLGGDFGVSVSMSGNLVAVTAPFETASGYYQAGHAYIFNAETGKLVKMLTSPNAQAGGEFGLWVSTSGKLLTVGAAYETADGYPYGGHAYVFYNV